MTTKSIRPGSATRAFLSLRRKIIGELNRFPSAVWKKSFGYGVHVDLSQKIGNVEIDGHFRDHNVSGIPEASDFLSVDIVPPFLGAIIDRCCGEPLEAAITRIFTYYTSIVHFL